MKQEHRFVAQLFSYIAPFVDDEEDLFISLDGMAAKRGVTEEVFQDSTVPDLWCTLIDGRSLCIEAKVMSWPQGFTVGREQHRAWFGSGTGAHPPTSWAIVSADLKQSDYWPHAAIRAQPTKKINAGKYFQVTAPLMTPMFRSVRELALHVLASDGVRTIRSSSISA